MSLWFNPKSRNRNPSGKFVRRRRPGTEKIERQSHRDWSWELTLHRAGATVRRTVCNVTIYDPHKSQRAYLDGFATPGQASAAAQAWIEDHLARKQAEQEADAGDGGAAEHAAIEGPTLAELLAAAVREVERR